ncbi:MAG TPA: universal stress protein, partial [Chloroflexota bacterium]|nr:universal stress protein [Chloroflexota bacterium]
MAYPHVLVPFDTSRLAQAALSFGAWIAWRGGGELDLLRAVVDRPPFSIEPLAGMAEPAAQVATAKTEMSLQAARLREKGLTVTGAAFLGEPASVILDYVERFGIDLVVMGTHARPLVERWLLGSVASEVARNSPVPVALVPREAKPTHDDVLRIMVSLDGSPVAESALQAALQLAGAVPAEVTLFEVLPGEGPSSDEKTAEWYREPVLGAGGYLPALQAQIAERGISVQLAYSAGAAGDEIVLFADRGKFDVVAIGTR